MTTQLKNFAYEMAIAGLLHDVGKVLQPAGASISPEVDRLEQMLCPVQPDGRYTHRHVLYTAQMLFQTESNFGRLDRSRIERVANYHHRPSTDRLDENLITKADWLASGHDRTPAGEEEPRTGLVSILSTLELSEVGSLSARIGNAHLPTSHLNFEESHYLPGSQQSSGEYAERCRQIANQLQSALNRDYANPEECLESLLGLTQRLLHAIPASRYRGHVPDVSLFDHSRMVAAIAACLALLDHGEARQANQIRGGFRFVSLGVGGIQDFIFHSIYPLEPGETDTPQTENKGSAKRLRARSFYLSLYSWLAARKVLDVIGLPLTNLVYDAGGHALLLIPDTPSVLERVENALREIALEVRAKLGGTLRFDYAVSREMRDHDFHRSQFQQVFRDIELDRSNARYRFPDERLLADTTWVRDSWVLEQQESLTIDREPFLKQLRKLGQLLPKARYLVIESGEAAEWSEVIFGMRVSLHVQRPSRGLVYALQLDAEEWTTPLLLSGSHLPVLQPDDQARLDALAEQQEFSSEEEPIRLGEPLPFHALAHLSCTAEGEAVSHPMLGVLKADVDLLGALFSYGFQGTGGQADAGEFEQGDRASLGRMAALSRSLDQFFKGFLTEKLRTEFQHIYTVFVGGDDLFLIGPWYDIVRLSQGLQDWFQQLTCNNPDVSFSAGIIFSKPATPVRHLAHLAEEALSAAKEAGRNRIGFGSVTLNWQQYLQAYNLHRLMVACAHDSPDRQGVNSSLYYRLLKYAKQALKFGPLSSTPGLQGTHAEMKWRAQMSYDLKRNLPAPTPERPLLQQLHAELMTIRSPVEDAPILYTAASLTLYFLRGNAT